MVVKASKYNLQTVDEANELENVNKRVHKRMKAFRLSNGLSKTECNRLMNLQNHSAWMSLEYSQRHQINLRTLVKIACIMGISVSELISPLPEELEYN